MKGKTEYQVQFRLSGVRWHLAGTRSSKREAVSVCRDYSRLYDSREWRVLRARTECDVVLEIAKKAPK